MSLHIVELFKDDLLVPWLYRRDADAADLAHFVNGVGNKLGKLAVAGHGAYAVVCRRVYKHAVVCDIVVLIAVVQGQSAERSDEYGGGELFAEQLKGRVHVGVGIERVHVDEYLLPLVVVARGGVAGQLAAGTGDAVAACSAVAHGACLAVRSHKAGCFLENFVVIHNCTSCIYCNFLLYQTPVRSKSGIMSSVAEHGSCQKPFSIPRRDIYSTSVSLVSAETVF